MTFDYLLVWLWRKLYENMLYTYIFYTIQYMSGLFHMICLFSFTLFFSSLHLSQSQSQSLSLSLFSLLLSISLTLFLFFLSRERAWITCSSGCILDYSNHSPKTLTCSCRCPLEHISTSIFLSLSLLSLYSRLQFLTPKIQIQIRPISTRIRGPAENLSRKIKMLNWSQNHL